MGKVSCYFECQVAIISDIIITMLVIHLKMYFARIFEPRSGGAYLIVCCFPISCLVRPSEVGTVN